MEKVQFSGHTLFFDHSGPMIRYVNKPYEGYNNFMLQVDSLNPETHIHFAMTPMELLRFGFKCIWAAISS